MRQAGSYLLVGGGATLIHLLVALALNGVLGLSPLWSNFVAFLCAWSFSYAANWRWTFAAARAHRSALPRFFAVSAAGFLINQAMVYCCTILLHWPFWVALIPVILIVPAVSYIASKFWAFVPDRNYVPSP
ncbi:hypothetical protein BH10PSE7_BH10PSE7_07590 [soil metagenome]